MILAEITGNGTFEAPAIAGQYALAIEGDFSGATVEFNFLDSNDESVSLTASSAWSFTEPPAFPQAFGFPVGVRANIIVSGGSSTILTVYAYRYHG